MTSGRVEWHLVPKVIIIPYPPLCPSFQDHQILAAIKAEWGWIKLVLPVILLYNSTPAQGHHCYTNNTHDPIFSEISEHKRAPSGLRKEQM